MTTQDEVLALLVWRIAAVMGVDAASVSGSSRFDEDLHADSLDLLEVVEGVERDLAARGRRAGLSDAELLGLRTVGEASERIAASSRDLEEGKGR